ncbi:MAG: adenosylcobinamide-GDP ribazoletransferase [Roseibium sp.]|nr:adenosylcobinamide-GDP ribazoletransferase [Roseibium sp.]
MSSESDQTSDSETKTGTNKTLDQTGSLIDTLSLVFADAAACVRFFSRLPLARVNSADDPARAPNFSLISRAAPLAGVFVALPAAGLGLFLGFTELPSLAVACLTVALLAATTGALHEDGLSDLADGFFGGATRERRLEIMKDSRIGSFGALALVLAVLLRVALLAALWQRFSSADAALLFLCAEALSRTLLVWQWQQRPLARPDGLAARFGKPGRPTLQQALLISLPLLLPALFILTIPALFLGLLIAATVAYATGQLAVMKIGGVTGDVLGAIQQLSGLGFLLGMLTVP